MTTAKERAVELFNANIGMIEEINQTEFRRHVMNTLIEEFSTPEKEMTIAAAATHYNNAKKLAESQGLVSGLGRSTPAPVAGTTIIKPKKTVEKKTIDDDACFTVVEVVGGETRRTMSFIANGDASEHFEACYLSFPEHSKNWRLIQGLGPNSGEPFRLQAGEKDITIETLIAIGLQKPQPGTTEK
jgi:hypothetical protein